MTLERGNLFDPQLVADLINKVVGKSSLVTLSQQDRFRLTDKRNLPLPWIPKLTS